MQPEKAFINFWDDYAIPEKSPHQLRDIAEHAFAAGRQSTAAPELLTACVLFEDLTRNGLCPGSEDLRQLQAAIAKATNL